MYKLTITCAKHKERTYEYAPSTLIDCMNSLSSKEILINNSPVVLRVLTAVLTSVGVLEFKLFNANMENVAIAIIEKYKEESH